MFVVYGRLVGSRIKIVYQDGDKVFSIKGELLDWNPDLKVLLIHNDLKHKDVYINASVIQRLEPLGDDE